MLVVALVIDLFAFHYVAPGYRLEYASVSHRDVMLAPAVARLRDEVAESGHRILAADGTHNPLVRPNLTRAWEDGRPATLIPADFGVLGVVVPAGAREVEIRIVPRSVWYGAGISAACLLLWVTLTMSVWRRARRASAT